MFTKVLVLCLVCTASVVGYKKGGKYYPACPSGYPLPAVCGQYCWSDSDCEYGKFCCRSGCLVTCLPKPKEGVCPAQEYPVICLHNQCNNDYDCPGIQKCCGSDYCKTCMVPFKPGNCPQRFKYGPCYAECGNDFDCPGDEKCCGSCPRICEKPCDHDD